MSAALSRKSRRFVYLLLGLVLAAMLASPSARAVDARSESASLRLAAKAADAMDRGDFLRAQKLYETAIVANPGNAGAFTGLGEAHQARNEIRFARKYYRIALSIDPADRHALSALAQLDLEAGNRAGAEAGLRKLRAFCPACEETRKLSRALGSGASDPSSPATDP